MHKRRTPFSGSIIATFLETRTGYVLRELGISSTQARRIAQFSIILRPIVDVTGMPYSEIQEHAKWGIWRPWCLFSYRYVDATVHVRYQTAALGIDIFIIQRFKCRGKLTAARNDRIAPAAVEEMTEHPSRSIVWERSYTNVSDGATQNFRPQVPRHNKE